MPICQRCAREIEDWEVEWFGSKLVCYNCFHCELADARRKAEEEAEECSLCGRKMPYWGSKKFQGKVYCFGCYDEAYRKYRKENSCTHCGKFLEKPEERLRGHKGDLLCQGCFSDSHHHFEPGARTITPRLGRKSKRRKKRSI